MIELENGLYVGCALTQAPDWFKEGVEGVKLGLRERGYKILDFVGSRPAETAEVFQWDINCVQSCDAMLAIADYPSIGLGWELGTATGLGKPTLAVAEAGRKITRFALGAAEVLPNFELERYSHLQEIPDRLDQFLGRILLSRT